MLMLEFSDWMGWVLCVLWVWLIDCEWDVLWLFDMGVFNWEIVKMLFVIEVIVKMYFVYVFEKFGVDS